MMAESGAIQMDMKEWRTLFQLPEMQKHKSIDPDIFLHIE